MLAAGTDHVSAYALTIHDNTPFGRAVASGAMPAPDDDVQRDRFDVARDLATEPRQLQSKYLYDALGSSLFDAICRLPWYRITRAEGDLLRAHAGAVVEPIVGTTGAAVVELGCGNGEKIVLLAEALLERGGSASVHLIDISTQALEHTRERLTRLHVSVVGHHSTYEDGLRRAAAARMGNGPMLVLLLGSNIGNFDPEEATALLRDVRSALQPGDRLLLGTHDEDVVRAEDDRAAEGASIHLRPVRDAVYRMAVAALRASRRDG